MNPTDIWMPFYPGDYLRDTMHLTTEQHGTYLLLIFHYWIHGPIPDDDDYLSSVTRRMRDGWLTDRNRIASFFQIRDGKWHHKRIDAEREKSKKNYESRLSASRKANYVRWNKENPEQPPPSGNPSRIHDGQVPGSVTVPPSPSPSVLEGEKAVSFPKSETESVEASATVGCPKEFAISTWQKAMGRGGTDARDIPIRSWPHHLATEWRYEQQRQAKHSGPNGNMSKGGVPVWQQIKSIEALLATEKEKLSKLHVSDRNLYPEQYAEDLKKVTPVKIEIRRLSEMLTELHRKLTHEKTHD